MALFLIGLIGFLGLHVFSALRSREAERDLRKNWGEKRYMGLYSVLSLVTFGVMILGYIQISDEPIIWVGPEMARTLALPLNATALIILAAAYTPVGYIKRSLHHPMMIAVVIWSASHLALGGDLPKLLLFGGFGAYAILSVAMAFRRGERVTKPPRLLGDGLAIVMGCVATAALLATGHAGL